jgi:hypothetical protein
LYYLIYSPLLKRKAKFQLYKLVEGKYVLQSSGQQPYWMPEVGLAIGAEQQVYGYADRELLYWYDENNVRYPTPTEKSVIEAKRADAEYQRAEIELAAKVAAQQEVNLLRERLRALGIDPDAIDPP